MNDPWQGPGPPAPVDTFARPEDGAYLYGSPPSPAPRRRAGRLVLAVAGAVVLVLSIGLVGVLAGHSVPGASADHRVKIYDPAGNASTVALPAGFHRTRDSDLQQGYLGADSGGDYPPYLDVYVDSRSQSRDGDVDAVARRIQTEDIDHGGRVVQATHDAVVDGRLVAQWRESYPKDGKSDAHTMLNAVVLLAHGAYLEVDYSDEPRAFSVGDATRAVNSVVTSLQFGA